MLLQHRALSPVLVPHSSIYAYDLSPFQKIRSHERIRISRPATSKYRHYPGNIGIYIAIDNLLFRAIARRCSSQRTRHARINQVRLASREKEEERNKDDGDQYFPVNQSSTTPREYRYYAVADVSNSDTAADRFVERGHHTLFSLYKYTHTRTSNLGCSGSEEDALVIRQRCGGLYIT